MEDIEKFIEQVEAKISFYIEAQLWTNIDLQQLKIWLNNFKDIEGKYYSAKLLNHFIFYNEKDVKNLCEFGFNDLIINRYVHKEDIKSNFEYNDNQLKKIKEEFVKRIAIFPLKDDGNPTESSKAVIARIFCHDLSLVSDQQIFEIENFEKAISEGFKHIIIVDDFIGSGDQIINFWEKKKIPFRGNNYSLNEISKLAYEIEFEYLCLVATNVGLENFKNKFPDASLKITCCEELTDEYRVFGKNSLYFSENEQEKSRKYLEEVCKKNNFNLLGHSDLDYAIAFHHTIPDSSLRLFWKQKDDWNNLFTNKNTRVTV